MANLITHAQAMAALVEHGSQLKAAQALDVGRITLRRALARAPEKPRRGPRIDIALPDPGRSSELQRMVKGASVARYVITSAQNATGIHRRFLQTLQTYCKARKAKLLIIPYRYRNPTSMWSSAAEHDDWWAADLAKYLIEDRVDLAPGLVLLADIKTQPTASDPLLGFESISGEKSAIIGHPKLEFTTIATPQNKLPKILTTTGSCTRRNYLPSKAGKKAEFHHTFGACVVEVSGKTYHIRQLNALEDGSFCDLDKEYDGDEIRSAEVAGLVMGDSHIEVIDPQVVKATFSAKDSIVNVLKPKKIVWHDAHDFMSQNHHHGVLQSFVLHHTGRNNVEAWLDHTFAFIDSVTGPDVVNVFVASNHPDALGRWVTSTDPRSDPENCIFWAKTFQMMCEGSKWTPGGPSSPDPFYYWAALKLKTAKQAIFLGRDQSYLIAGIDVSNHGDAGSNGARGDRRGFSKIGAKTVIGHGHSPGIKNGAYQVGTSSFLRLGYNRGPSSWLHTHCVIHKTGKRQLVSIIGGEWRA